MSSFDLVMSYIFEDEGGWTAGRNDPGGETYRGISRVNHPDWSGWAIIDGMNQALLSENEIIQNTAVAEAVNQFYLEYLPSLSGFDQSVANKIADLIVQLDHNGIKIVQMALAKIQVGPIVADGVWGPRTEQMVLAAEPERLCRALRYFVAKHFVENDSNSPDFAGLLWRAVR